MHMKTSSGARFRQALAVENPLQIVGVINAYAALLAQRAGFLALYLSGAGVANASHGLPDLAITTMQDVLEDARRITAICDLPLLVDVDTGWGGSFNIARMVRECIRTGVAAIHMEDQVGQKRCGHRPNKEIVAVAEMVDRIKSAVDARTDPEFVIMARTDALASEGMVATIERCHAYVAAGADAIFAEAVPDVDSYRQITMTVPVPILANITEFGKTPLYSLGELRAAGVRMALYPLSAFRAMSRAAIEVYTTLRRDGTQKDLVDRMQTREDLYDYLGYHAYERKLDRLFAASGGVDGEPVDD